MDGTRRPQGGRILLSRSYRSLWSVTAGITLVSGVLTAALTVPVTALVGLFLAVGVMTGGSAWAWASVNLAPTRWALSVFIWSGVWSVTAVGLTELLGGWGLLLVVMLGLASPPLVERVAWSLEAWTRTKQPAALDADDDLEPALLARDLRFDDPHASRLLDPACPLGGKPPISALTTADLGRLWKVSGRWLRRGFDGPDMVHLVGVRAACLDELERRDPEALHRWLAAREASALGPTRFMAGDPQPPEAL